MAPSFSLPQTKMIDCLIEQPTPKTKKQEISLGSEGVGRLEDWNIHKDQIQKLTLEILPQFNYAGCVEKIRRISNKNLFLDTKNKTVTIPFLYDIMGRGDGQCGDLADQLLVNGNFIAWLEDINSNRYDNIIPYFCVGNSKTHFNIPGGRTHIFVGLGPENQDQDDMVVVDPSFGVVGTLKETGYSYIEARKDRASELSRQLHGIVKLSTITKTGFGKSSVSIRDSRVLGVSEDRKYAYALALAKYSDSEKITPIIQVFLENSESVPCFWIDPDFDIVTGSKTHPFESLTKEAQLEIEKMLKTGDGFSYTENKQHIDITSLPENSSLHANIIV